jgi:hypothetical protein
MATGPQLCKDERSGWGKYNPRIGEVLCVPKSPGLEIEVKISPYHAGPDFPFSLFSPRVQVTLLGDKWGGRGEGGTLYSVGLAVATVWPASN